MMMDSYAADSAYIRYLEHTTFHHETVKVRPGWCCDKRKSKHIGGIIRYASFFLRFGPVLLKPTEKRSKLLT